MQDSFLFFELLLRIQKIKKGENMENSWKVGQIVACIRQYPFESEVDELLEDTDSVLAPYRVDEADLSKEEWLLLVDELLPLAESFEIGEAMRLALQDEGLAWA
ncbi:MAG TPA: hypothetical protein DEP85_00640 [Holosporales bacterium]|nr:hypothetical protein [Holosporales bacterium]